MKTRAVARSSLGWAFGMAVSILLLALWGRSVVADTDTLAESLSPLAGSTTVVDFVANWMSEQMLESGADPEIVDATIDYFFGTTEVGDTLDRFAVEVVHAAASTDPAGSSIDMAALVYPAVPELTMGLNELGYPSSENGVSDAVAQLDPLVIRRPGSVAMVGPGSPTAVRLGTAALLASVALIFFGSAHVWLSDDRLAAIRGLATRVALGALSFAVFLKLGSWVLDPRGGRAPVPEAIAAVAGSKWVVPLQVAMVAALIAGAIYLGRRLLRRAGVSPSPSVQSTPRRERRRSLSGSR